MSGVGFLSRFESGTLSLIGVSMSVSEEGPAGSVSVSVALSPGEMLHDWQEGRGALVVKCHPRVTVGVTDDATATKVASFEVVMSTSCQCHVDDDSTIVLDEIEDAFLECLLSAYSYARNKIDEFARMSPMDGLLLPNADAEGLRKMIREDIAAGLASPPS